MKKVRIYLIAAFIVVLLTYIYVYLNLRKNTKEAFAKYKSYADKYAAESKVQTEYNVKTNENIGNSNNKYIRDMLKDSSLRRVNKPVVRNIRRYTR